jgi:hypothetical protein
LSLDLSGTASAKDEGGHTESRGNLNHEKHLAVHHEPCDVYRQRYTHEYYHNSPRTCPPVGYNMPAIVYVIVSYKAMTPWLPWLISFVVINATACLLFSFKFWHLYMTETQNCRLPCKTRNDKMFICMNKCTYQNETQ